MRNHSELTMIDGFKCYAPQLAFQNEGFDPQCFETLVGIEEKYFWFRARNQLLYNVFKKYLGSGGNKKVLEIGCGNGYVLQALKKLGYQLIGSEIYLSGLKNAQKRLPDIELIQMDARHMPFQNELDAIGAFDVLEHITEDFQVIQNVYVSLKPQGYFFITVPQYAWMWSYTDDYAKHKRRYTRKDLCQKLRKAGFEILFTTSFITLLFPLVFISRHIKKPKKLPSPEKALLDEFALPPWLNRLFYLITSLEVTWIKQGLSLPFGNSLLVVAKKT
ncbi:MAG: class I SAM-dependent methyltransferase [Bacteroidia bacterium]